MTDIEKREEKINYYMSRVKDLENNSVLLEEKCGCYIVGVKYYKYEIVSFGWDTFPPYFKDSFSLDDGKSKKDPNSRHPYIIHAAENAIINIDEKIKDYEELILFSTYEPNASCLRLLTAIGIDKVYYREKNNSITESDRMVIDKLCNVLSIEYIHVK